jgi:hypothetical protein
LYPGKQWQASALVAPTIDVENAGQTSQLVRLLTMALNVPDVHLLQVLPFRKNPLPHVMAMHV